MRVFKFTLVFLFFYFLLGAEIAGAAGNSYDLILSPNGTVTVDGNQKLQVKGGVDFDDFTWQAIKQPGNVIDSFTATLHLPKPADNMVEPTILALKGVASSSAQVVDSQTVIYNATNVGPQAEVSVIAKFAKGYLNLSASTVAQVEIQKLNPLWIYGSIIIPLLGLVVLLYMYIRRLLDRAIPQVQEPLTKPPEAISPALTSILYENKIEPEAIAATLVHLAQRGFISIFNKGNNFIFAKEKEIDLSTPAFQVGMHEVKLNSEEVLIAEKEGLKPFEKILLSKLFVSAHPISSKEDVKVRIGHGLFSKKVKAIYEYLFSSASELGYFVSNAILIRREYLLAGWLLGILGFVGFMFGVWRTPDPKYFLLLWVALIILSYLIITLAPYVPLRTKEGRTQLGEFLAFRAFLTTGQPAPENMGINEFFAYLPYAWALRSQYQWAKRFEKMAFSRPGWYFSSKKVNSTVEFVDDIDNLIDFVAEAFAAVREKTLV